MGGGGAPCHLLGWLALSLASHTTVPDLHRRVASRQRSALTLTSLRCPRVSLFAPLSYWTPCPRPRRNRFAHGAPRAPRLFAFAPPPPPPFPLGAHAHLAGAPSWLASPCFSFSIAAACLLPDKNTGAKRGCPRGGPAHAATTERSWASCLLRLRDSAFGSASLPSVLICWQHTMRRCFLFIARPPASVSPVLTPSKLNGHLACAQLNVRPLPQNSKRTLLSERGGAA